MFARAVAKVQEFWSGVEGTGALCISSTQRGSTEELKGSSRRGEREHRGTEGEQQQSIRYVGGATAIHQILGCGEKHRMRHDVREV